MKEDSRIYDLLQIISKDLNTVVQNQIEIYAKLEAIQQSLDEQNKEQC